MPETRSGKAIPNDTKELDKVSIIEEKFNKFKVDFLSEIKDLIHLEVEKAMKKQKKKTRTQLCTNFKSVLLNWRMTMMIWSNMDVVSVCI